MSEAFQRAERMRRVGMLGRPLRLPAWAHHHRRLDELAREAGIEKPDVFWAHDAEEATERLEEIVRQPMLEGFGA